VLTNARLSLGTPLKPTRSGAEASVSRHRGRRSA
jgi:hypothetical protein